MSGCERGWGVLRPVMFGRRWGSVRRAVALGAVVCVVMGLAVMAATAAGEPEKVKLVYKFSPGETLRYKLTITGEGTTTVTPQDTKEKEEKVPMTMSGTMMLSEKVVHMYDDGSAALEMMLSGLDMTVNITQQGKPQKIHMMMQDDKLTVEGPEGKREIDLKQAGMGGIMTTPTRVRMWPDGKIEWASSAGMEQLSRMTGMDLSQMVKASETPFPDRAIGPGETWDYTVEFPLPQQERQGEIKMKAKLAGFEGSGERRMAKVDMNGDVDLSGLTMTTETPQGTRTVTFDTFKETLKGEFTFDIARGRTTQASYDTSMTMAMETKGEKAARVRSEMKTKVTMVLE